MEMSISKPSQVSSTTFEFTPEDVRRRTRTSDMKKLHEYARQGCLTSVIRLINRGVCVNSLDAIRQTPLHVAAKAGHVDVVRYLITEKAPSNATDKYGRTALILAAMKGHHEIVESLLKRGEVPDIADRNGRTALHYAVYAGHKQVVDILRKAGARVKALDVLNATPLHSAECHGCAEVVEAECLNTADKHGRTLLILAAKSGHTETVELLLERGVVIDAAGENGMTALHYAAYTGHKQAVEVLLKAGADVKTVDILDATPLHAAAEKGYADVVEMFVKHGACVNVIDIYGQTPLHKSAMKGHTNSVQVLVQKKATLNIKDKSGCTPHQTALKYGYHGILTFLLPTPTSPTRSQRTTRNKENGIGDHKTGCQSSTESPSSTCQPKSHPSSLQVSTPLEPSMSQTPTNLCVQTLSSALASPVKEAVGEMLQKLSSGQLNYGCHQQTVSDAVNGGINMTLVVNCTVTTDKMVVKNMDNVRSDQLKINHVGNLAQGDSSINIYYNSCQDSQDDASCSGSDSITCNHIPECSTRVNSVS